MHVNRWLSIATERIRGVKTRLRVVTGPFISKTPLILYKQGSETPDLGYPGPRVYRWFSEVLEANPLLEPQMSTCHQLRGPPVCMYTVRLHCEPVLRHC